MNNMVVYRQRIEVLDGVIESLVALRDETNNIIEKHREAIQNRFKDLKEEYDNKLNGSVKQANSDREQYFTGINLKVEFDNKHDELRQEYMRLFTDEQKRINGKFRDIELRYGIRFPDDTKTVDDAIMHINNIKAVYEKLERKESL